MANKEKTPEAKPDKYAVLVAEARDKHTEGWLTPSFPGYLRFFLLDDFVIGPLGGVEMQVGTYLVHEGDNVETAPLYRLDFAEETLAEVRAIANGETQGSLFDDEESPDGEDAAQEMQGEATSREIKVTVSPVVTDGRALTVTEFLIWLAIASHAKDGDLATANELVAHFYGIEPNNAPEQPADKPRKHQQPTSKLAQRVIEIKLNELIEVDVTGEREEREGREIFTIVKFEYEGEDAEAVKLSKTMTRFEREVHFAAGTLWAAGIKVFTPQKVAEVLTGNPKSSGKLLKSIEAAIDKQRRTFATIDFADEARGRSLEFEGKKVEDFKLETYAINASKLSVKVSGGRIVKGYQMHRAPVLYEYSSTLGQVASVPIRMLRTTDAGSNTETNIVIRGYLVRRIYAMKGKGGAKLSRIIKYQTIYEEAGLDNPSRKKRAAVNDYVCKLLDIYKGLGEIKGWRERMNGQRRDAVEIIL